MNVFDLEADDGEGNDDDDDYSEEDDYFIAPPENAPYISSNLQSDLNKFEADAKRLCYQLLEKKRKRQQEEKGKKRKTAIVSYFSTKKEEKPHQTPLEKKGLFRIKKKATTQTLMKRRENDTKRKPRSWPYRKKNNKIMS